MGRLLVLRMPRHQVWTGCWCQGRLWSEIQSMFEWGSQTSQYIKSVAEDFKIPSPSCMWNFENGFWCNSAVLLQYNGEGRCVCWWRAGGRLPLVWTRSAPASGSPRKPLVGFSSSCTAHAALRNVKVACTDGILSLGKTAAEHTLKTVLI